MRATVAQINISRGGVPKYPVPEGLVTPLGIQGDLCAHPRIHGGPRQALLLICAEAIEHLISKGYPLFFGALGENITMHGIDHRQLRIGQRYRIGEVFVELTKVRGPCSALDVYGSSIKQDMYDRQVKAGDPASPRWGISGMYAAILRTGTVRQDDIIALVDQVV
ncbi:MAG: MOSC domain-containing protein [Acidobacteriota bacterium]|nr:MOSC domain-containing protein [Acidobacteriota bacterium]